MATIFVKLSRSFCESHHLTGNYVEVLNPDQYDKDGNDYLVQWDTGTAFSLFFVVWGCENTTEVWEVMRRRFPSNEVIPDNRDDFHVEYDTILSDGSTYNVGQSILNQLSDKDCE